MEYVVAAAIFVVAGFLPEVPRIALWVIGLGVTIVPAIAHCTTAPPLEERQLIERLGALTIIMCGEAFVKVALAANADSLDGIDVVTVAFEFVMVFAVWAIYFDDIPKAGASPTPRGRSTWLGAHLLLHLGIIGVAIGVSRFVEFHPGQDIPTPDVAAVALPLAGIYCALILISFVSRRVPLGRLTQIRLGGVVAVAVVVGVAEWATWFDTYWSIAAFALVAIVEAGIEAMARAQTTVRPAAAVCGTRSDPPVRNAVLPVGEERAQPCDQRDRLIEHDVVMRERHLDDRRDPAELLIHVRPDVGSHQAVLGAEQRDPAPDLAEQLAGRHRSVEDARIELPGPAAFDLPQRCPRDVLEHVGQ